MSKVIEDDTASPEPSDSELVLKSQGGSLRAFDVLVTRYRGKIYAMIYNLIRNEADAWDLAQDVFLKAWKALPRFEERANFFTWLYRIAHNVTYDELRKRKKRDSTELDDNLHSGQVAPGARTAPQLTENPDSALQNAELGDKIRAAMDKLGEEHRLTIYLKEVEGLRYHEIARVMECEEGTVMSRLYYARKKLQQLLKEDYEALES